MQAAEGTEGKPGGLCPGQTWPGGGGRGYLDEALNEPGALSIISLGLDGIHLHVSALLMLVPMLVVMLMALVLLVEALWSLHTVGLLFLELGLRGWQQP